MADEEIIIGTGKRGKIPSFGALNSGIRGSTR